MKPEQPSSRNGASEAFEVWWYDYRIKNGLGDHTAKAQVALDAFSAGVKAERGSRAPLSERGLSREPTEVMVQSVRGIKIQPEMVRVIWRSMWDAAQSNERSGR